MNARTVREGRVLRWGVIGSGGIAARRTIPEGLSVSPLVRLVALFDVDRARNEELAARWGAIAAQSIEELLSHGLDAVYVASPVHLHEEHVLSCAAAGVNVLCEKPLGLDVEEARSMVSACDVAGVLLGGAMVMRFVDQNRAAQKLINRGALGHMVLGRAQLSCWFPPMAGSWRQQPSTSGGGALIDMGSHCLDLLEYFLGPIQSLRCVTGNVVQPYEVEDAALVSTRHASGAMGVVDSLFCIPDAASENRLELYGTHGSILATGTIGQDATGTMTRVRTDEQTYDAIQLRGEADRATVPSSGRSAYLSEVEDFCYAVIEGRQPEVGGRQFLRLQQLLADCYASAETGSEVAVEAPTWVEGSQVR